MMMSSLCSCRRPQHCLPDGHTGERPRMPAVTKLVQLMYRMKEAMHCHGGHLFTFEVRNLDFCHPKRWLHIIIIPNMCFAKSPSKSLPIWFLYHFAFFTIFNISLGFSVKWLIKGPFGIWKYTCLREYGLDHRKKAVSITGKKQFPFWRRACRRQGLLVPSSSLPITTNTSSTAAHKGASSSTGLHSTTAPSSVNFRCTSGHRSLIVAWTPSACNLLSSSNV